MFRIVMVSIIVTIGLAGCGEEVSQKPINEEKVTIEVTPSPLKNEVNTQDVKKNDVQAIKIQSQTTEASQAVVESLAKELKVPTTKHAEPLKVVEAKKDEVLVVDTEVKATKITPDSVAASQPKQQLALGNAVKGKTLAKRCAACHDFGAKDKVGPHLQGIFNRAAGQSGFKRHSAALKTANWTWDEAHLLKWLCDSKAAVKEFTGNASTKTKMPKQNMCGVKGHDIVAYLKTL